MAKKKIEKEKAKKEETNDLLFLNRLVGNLQKRIWTLEQRFGRLVTALDKSKSVRGL